MARPALIIAALFVLVAVILNTPLRDYFEADTSPRVQSQLPSVEPGAGLRMGVVRERTPPRTRTEPTAPSLGARDWAARVQGRLDSPMEPIQYQLAESGVSPALSRQGDLRIFTYRFADGSELEFAGRPSGGQGLLLYYVDIRD